MRFEDIRGNESVKKALVGMADSGKLAHAMLFYENDGCGALPVILAYFQYLNCRNPHNGDACGECPSCNRVSKLIHPDLHFVFPVSGGSKVSSSEKTTSESYLQYWRELLVANPYFLESELYAALGIEGKSGAIAVEEAKSILTKLSLTSVENGYKAVVIYLPEKMNAAAANRLLKSVEEPPEKTLFFFVTHAPEKVMQTVFSRCQSLRILPLSKEDVAEVLRDCFSVSEEQARVLANNSYGSIGTALAGLGDRRDNNVYMDLFADLVNASLAKDLMGALEAGESIAALDSREKQKGFCIFAADCIRKIFLLKQGLPALSNVTEDEKDFFVNVAARCKDAFCLRASDYIDKAVGLIERNVNAKIVFCDLVNRFFISI